MRRLAALVTLAALGLAACGGGGEEEAGPAGDRPVDAWVEEVCTGLGEWLTGIRERSAGLAEDLEGLTRGDFEGLKDLTVGFVRDAVEDTESLIADLEGAGAPAVDDGVETARTLVAALGDVRDLFAEALDDLEALPTDDPEALAQGLQEIGASIQANADTVAGLLDEAGAAGLGGDELDRAFARAPACESVGG